VARFGLSLPGDAGKMSQWEAVMIKYIACCSILILLSCSDSTAPAGRPTIVFTSFNYPTASKLVFDIDVMDSLGGHVRNVTRDSARDDDPAWSPDGSKIIFSSAGRDATGAWHLFLMRDDGSGLTPLTPGTGSEWGPDWSPDGAKIAFISSSRLSVMNADGTGVTQLLTDTAFEDHPSWSPDGRIVFFSNRGGHLFVINANGSGLTLIGDTTATDETPSWSPDGRRIAFSSNRDTRAFQIWTMNPDGSSRVRLTSDSGGNGYPAWSPDGSKIVFVSYRDSSSEIYVMNANGSGQTRLTHIPTTSKVKPQWRP